MVLCLVFDVSFDFLQVRLTDGETGVPGLPMKVLVGRSILRLHPLRTTLLDFFNDFLEGIILREGE